MVRDTARDVVQKCLSGISTIMAIIREDYAKQKSFHVDAKRFWHETLWRSVACTFDMNMWRDDLEK